MSFRFIVAQNQLTESVLYCNKALESNIHFHRHVQDNSHIDEGTEPNAYCIKVLGSFESNQTPSLQSMKPLQRDSCKSQVSARGFMNSPVAWFAIGLGKGCKQFGVSKPHPTNNQLYRGTRCKRGRRRKLEISSASLSRKLLSSTGQNPTKVTKCNRKAQSPAHIIEQALLLRPKAQYSRRVPFLRTQVMGDLTKQQANPQQMQSSSCLKGSRD